jgi:hypothetical protein
MPDSQDPKAQDPPKELTPEEAEAHFWEKHKEHTLGVLEEWFEKKSKERQETGTSRGTGRATIPGIFADIMFGKPKQD